MIVLLLSKNTPHDPTNNLKSGIADRKVQVDP